MSYSMTKEAKIGAALRSFKDASKLKIGNAMAGVGDKWRKIPGVARYGMGTAATAAFPTWMYMSGKGETEGHIANTAYDDAYNLAQNRIGKEWENLPSWQRYAVAALGPQNAMAIKEWWDAKGSGLPYSSVDGMGNKQYY